MHEVNANKDQPKPFKEVKSADNSTIYLELTCDADSLPNLSVYSLDSNNAKVILASKVFDIASENSQIFTVPGFDKFKIEHYAHNNKSWFNVSVDTVNNPLHINTNYNLDLNQVYSLHGLNVNAAKHLSIGEIRTGANGHRSNTQIKAKTCIMRDAISCSNNLTMHAENIYMPANVALQVGGSALLASTKDTQLQGNITAVSQLGIRAEGELSYDINNLHASEVALQVSKVAQMQFPNNVLIHEDMIDDSKEGVEFTGNKLESPISYELIGPDQSTIQISNTSFFPSLKIKALNNHVVIGTEEKKAHLLGKKISIDASSIDLSNGKVVGTDILLLKSQTDITFGAIDIIKALAAGKPSTRGRQRCIGSKLLHIHAGRKLTMHQTSVFVRGIMWLRAKELDSRSTSINVFKDTYVDIERATIDQIRLNLSAADHKILYPKEQPRACTSHIGSSVWATHGTMHISQNTHIAMNAGVIYAGQITGPLATNMPDNPLQFSSGSDYSQVLSSANVQHAYKRGMFAHMNYQHTFRSILNSLILNDVNATESLAMLHDEYLAKPNLPIDEQDMVCSSLLFKAINKAVINASKRAESASEIIKPISKGKMGLMGQLWHLRELRANILVSVWPSAIDEQLFAAIKKGELNAVQDAIANGACINAVDPVDDCLYNALQLAIVANKPEIAKFLAQIPNIKFDYLTAGANPKTALDLAKERASMPSYSELIPIVVSKTPPAQTGVVDYRHRNARNIADLQAKADIEAQVGRLRIRDEDILAAFYTKNTKELLEKAKETILATRKDWLESTEKERGHIVAEQKLVAEAIAACMTGDNLEAILKLKNLDDEQLLWKIFCECQPLQLAIKHNQVKAVACLIDNGVEYLTALSQAQEDLEQDVNLAQVKHMDFSPGGMLDVLSTHMQQDVIAKMQSEDVAYSKEHISLTMTMFAQLLINKAQDMSGYNFTNNIDAKLGDYFGKQISSLEAHCQQVEESFTKVSEQYLQEIHKVLNTHGDKISITRFHYNKLQQQIIAQYNQELTRLRDEQKRIREAYLASMKAAAKKARKKGLVKIFTVAIAVGICAVVAPQLLATVLPNLGTTGLAIGTGAITGGVSSTVAGANRGNILKSIGVGAASAGFGNLAGSVTSNGLTNVAEAERKLLSQMANIAASNVPGTVINGGNYLENVATNVAGSVLSANIPNVNLGKLSSDEMKEVVKVIDKTANILISATPALIGRGDTKEKLLRYAGLATQLTAQNLVSTFVENSASKANAPSEEVVSKESDIDQVKGIDSTNASPVLGKSVGDIDLTPNLSSMGGTKAGHASPAQPIKKGKPVENKNLPTDIGLEHRLNMLQQQKKLLEHDNPSAYSHSFNEKKYAESFIQAAKEYEKLFVKHQKNSEFYHAQQTTLKSQTGLFKGTAAAIASDDLEQTLGQKVFAQANDLRRLQNTMRSYIAQDIATEISSIKHQLSLQEINREHQQRAFAGNESVIKDVGAEIGINGANILREAKLHVDGFTTRHSDTMKVVSATAAVAGGIMAPAASLAGIVSHAALSSDLVQPKMTHAFDAAMKKVGVDKVSREDLSKFAAEATAFGVGGISAAKLPEAVGKGISISKEFIKSHNFNKPIIFNFKDGKLYSGPPFDAIELQKPITAKNPSGAEDVSSKAFTYTEAEAAQGMANFAQAEKMRVNLELQQIFTKDGRLTEAGIKAARPIMRVDNFHELSPAYKAMVERGNIEHWHKCRFPLEMEFHVPGNPGAFKAEVHVYKNVVTNEAYYDLDYKIKIPELDIHVTVEEFINNMSFTWRPKP